MIDAIQQYSERVQHRQGKSHKSRTGRENVWHHSLGSQGESIAQRGLFSKRRKTFYAILSIRYPTTFGEQYPESKEKAARAQWQVGLLREEIEIATNEHEGINTAMIR